MNISPTEQAAVIWRGDLIVLRPAIDWTGAGLAAVISGNTDRLPLIAMGCNEYDRFLRAHPDPAEHAALADELSELIRTISAVAAAPNRRARRRAKRR